MTFLHDRAIEAVEMAKVVYEICQQARDVDLADNLGVDFISQWVGYYNAPDEFMGQLFQFLNPEASPENLEFIQSIYNRENLEDFLKGCIINAYSNQDPDLLKSLKEELPDDFDDIEDDVPESLPENFFERCKTQPKLLFYFKVWFPCWIEYGEFLPAIMQRAVQGDHTALENLIRLDPCILSHPQIQIEYQKIRCKNPSQFDYLCKVQQGKGLKELTPTNIKYLFGAYIYRLFKKMDSQMQIFAKQSGLELPKMAISVEKILDLFNQHAKRTTGQLYDGDFESVTAFKAGVSRTQSFWDNLFQ
jgi:hypothetical protein